MKAIFVAIGTALRAAFAVLRSVISIPGRLAGALLGGAGPAPVGDSPLVEDLAAQVAKADAEAQDNWKRIADAIWNWCMDSLIADGPVSVPTWLPRPVREWLPGLTAAEAEKLANADKTATQAHARQLYAVPGVRRVQRLDPVEWTPEPVSCEPAPGFLAGATCAPAPRA